MSAQQSAIAALGRTGPILEGAPPLEDASARAAKRSIAASQKSAPQEPHKRPDGRRVDRWMLGGILITIVALASGIAATRVPLSYFFQPAGVLIVIGGTLGATVVTTPKRALQQAARRVLGLLWERGAGRARLVEDIMSYIRVARTQGLLGIEPMLRECRHERLRESLTLALDVQKEELQTAIETRMRLRERRGEEDARTLETAGGFAPTIGVLGTVVGLIDVLRRFSDLTAVAGGVGTAFASTLYGIGLANLLLLPLAHRIRAAVAADFETEELILEGMLCLFDGVHPALAEERLNAFLDRQHTA
jgi:chemotaxis protein MotA